MADQETQFVNPDTIRLEIDLLTAQIKELDQRRQDARERLMATARPELIHCLQSEIWLVQIADELVIRLVWRDDSRQMHLKAWDDLAFTDHQIGDVHVDIRGLSKAYVYGFESAVIDFVHEHRLRVDLREMIEYTGQQFQQAQRGQRIIDQLKDRARLAP